MAKSGETVAPGGSMDEQIKEQILLKAPISGDISALANCPASPPTPRPSATSMVFSPADHTARCQRSFCLYNKYTLLRAEQSEFQRPRRAMPLPPPGAAGSWSGRCRGAPD